MNFVHGRAAEGRPWERCQPERAPLTRPAPNANAPGDAARLRLRGQSDSYEVPRIGNLPVPGAGGVIGSVQ
jgi:hypothetical protein